MRKTALLLLALVCGLSLSCFGRSPVMTVIDGRLEAFVHWQGQGLADRRLEVVELGLVQWTDAAGLAAFRIPAGSYTLRAFVNSGGPSAFREFRVTMRPGETERVEVPDCLPCVSPS